MYKKSILTLLSILFLSSISFAAKDNKKTNTKDIPVGKITLLKGTVSALFPHTMKAKDLKKGDFVFEDTSLLSKEKSFAKIKLQDGSFLTLGPKSKIVINLATKDKENVITLLNGKVRAKVKKILKEADKKASTDKFFIKTRVASVGVRGTEFMTTFNFKSKRTSVLTYEGEVGFKKLERKEAGELAKETVNKSDLIQKLKSSFKSDIEVAKVGDFTTVGVVDKKPVEPVKVNYQQFALLMKDESLGVEAEKISKKTIIAETKKVKNLYKIEEKTNREGLKEGGLIAASEGFYIPPKGKGVVGKIDTKGDYVPPKDLKLDPIKGFIPAVDKKKNPEKAKAIEEKAKELNEEVLKDQAEQDPENPAYSKYFDL